MFCDRCGAVVQSDQRFCGQCGRQFAASGVMTFPRRSRVREHIRLLGILWLALGALSAVGAVILFVLANTLFVRLPQMTGDPAATSWLHPFIAAIAIVVAVKAAAAFVAGWGLLQRESWARVVTIVLAFLALFHVPFGTALGIYSLWVLLPAESDLDYQEQVRSANAA